MKVITYFSYHNHCEFSNLRLLDSINKIEEMLLYAARIGLKGLCLSDHECLSGHVQMIRTTKELKKKGKLPEDFKIGLGNEIYLVDSLEEVRDNYQSGVTKFYHFVLVAKNKIGHRQLRILSSRAWEDSFYTGQMQRCVTTKSFIEEVVAESKGNLIASTACLGGEFGQLVLELVNKEKVGDKSEIQNLKLKIHEFITWCIDVFGRENFFIEIQPSLMVDQIEFNQKAIHIAKAYELPFTVTTDSHYLSLEDKKIHKAYLNSKEGDREVDDFYSTTYIQSPEEVIDYLSQGSISEDDIETAMKNTLTIMDKIEQFDLYHDVIVPKIKLPKFEVRHIFKNHYNEFEYIKNFAFSDEEQDRYLLKMIEDGCEEKGAITLLAKEKYMEILARIDVELEQLWKITNEINTKLSSYYVTTRKIIDLIWDDNGGDSLSGVARGSVTGYYICYIIGITQMNPMKWGLPYWRHIHYLRPELPKLYWVLVVNLAKGCVIINE